MASLLMVNHVINFFDNLLMDALSVNQRLINIRPTIHKIMPDICFNVIPSLYRIAPIKISAMAKHVFATTGALFTCQPTRYA